MNTNTTVKLEYVLIAAAAVFFYLKADFAWYWLVPMFFAYDLGAIGYLINRKIGAVTYNIAHSFILPILFLVLYAAWEPQQWLLFMALTQLLHIGLDRSLGYGLKYGDSFSHTHLGKVGPKKA
jgi:hypothetical protein